MAGSGREPEGVELRSSDRTFRVRWSDGHESWTSYRQLRLACACAVCVDERTGARLLDPSSVPQDVEPGDVEQVGNYGLRITWEPGSHSTGIYTWDRLRELCACELCLGG